MNHYERLGVTTDASRDVIRTAYRRRARELHPDATGVGDDDRMAAINEAWYVLGDADRRRRYDDTIASPDVPRAAGPVGVVDLEDASVESRTRRTLTALITAGMVLGATAVAMLLLIALLQGH